MILIEVAGIWLTDVSTWVCLNKVALWVCIGLWVLTAWQYKGKADRYKATIQEMRSEASIPYQGTVWDIPIEVIQDSTKWDSLIVVFDKRGINMRTYLKPE